MKNLFLKLTNPTPGHLWFCFPNWPVVNVKLKTMEMDSIVAARAAESWWVGGARPGREAAWGRAVGAETSRPPVRSWAMAFSPTTHRFAPTFHSGLEPSPCFSNFLARTTFVLESLLEAKNPGQDAFLGILSLALEITLVITAYLIIVWFVFTNDNFFGKFVFWDIAICVMFYAKT